MTSENGIGGGSGQPPREIPGVPGLALDRTFDWRDPFFQVGVVLSVCWTIASIVILRIWADWPEKGLPPSEWGDLAAGFAAPLAFFWLVLGFLQQGKELRLSSRALMLQVEELRSTVKHQAELAAAAREQVSMSLRQEEQERQARRLAARPRFIFSARGAMGGPQGTKYNFFLTNIGGEVSDVQIFGDGRDEPKQMNFLGREGRTFELFFRSPPQHPFALSITYRDRDGERGRIDYFGKTKGDEIRFDPQIVPLGALGPSDPTDVE